jgi:hypothetical protein
MQMGTHPFATPDESKFKVKNQKATEEFKNYQRFISK